MDFVAHAVKDDRRMIAVSQNRVVLVRMRPFLEIEVIVVWAFRHGPAVKEFVHYHQSHAVAQVEKFRRRRVMRGANGIYAKRFQGRQSLLPNAERHRCAKRAAFMMQADAFDFKILPVQPEARVGGKMEFPDAKDCRHLIDGCLPGNNFTHGAIKLRVLQVPQCRLGESDSLR
jgi:hypothetical protein